MVELAEAMSAPGAHLVPAALMRFDQQETTRWHIDGGPDRCVLMLGYEPTRVASELRLSPLRELAAHLGSSAAEAAHAAQSGKHDAWIDAHSMRVEMDCDRYPVVLVNNSVSELGVLHRGCITSPDPSAKRVVSSALFELSDTAVDASAELEAFIAGTEVL